jgi:hypothetical protein
MNLRLRAFAPLVFLSCLAAGCASRAQLQAPAGFASLDDDRKDFDFRATSAKGVVVGVRSEPNDLKANVDFWTDALDLRLRREGYAAQAAKVVTTPQGLTGKQIRYLRDEDQRPYCYWLTVFATNDRVYVVEAGGDKQAFDPATAEVEQSIASLRTR